jgi:hypothetical protein
MASGDCNRLKTQVFVSVIVKCNYESCVNVINKSKMQSKAPSTVTPKSWQYVPPDLKLKNSAFPSQIPFMYFIWLSE